MTVDKLEARILRRSSVHSRCTPKSRSRTFVSWKRTMPRRTAWDARFRSRVGPRRTCEARQCGAGRSTRPRTGGPHRRRSRARAVRTTSSAHRGTRRVVRKPLRRRSRCARRPPSGRSRRPWSGCRRAQRPDRTRGTRNPCTSRVRRTVAGRSASTSQKANGACSSHADPTT